MATEDPQRAAAYLEKHRQPVRPDVEIALARAYLAAHDKTKASEILHRLYFEMPLSAEADAAAGELRSMGEGQPVGNFEQRHTRAALLLKAKRYQDAASELSRWWSRPRRQSCSMYVWSLLQRCIVCAGATTPSIFLKASCRTPPLAWNQGPGPVFSGRDCAGKR